MKQGLGENKDEGSQRFSAIIDLLRFPLAVLVVAIHWNFTIRDRGYLPFYDECTEGAVPAACYMLRELMSCAVPAFFVISGYLFFYAKDGGAAFTWPLYVQKLQRRVRTLLIPYLLWNAITLVGLCIGSFSLQALDPTAWGGTLAAMVRTHGWHILWDFTANKRPILVPLWYLRDLMVMVLSAPAVYFLLQPLKRPVLAWGRNVLFFGTLALLQSCDWWPFTCGFSFRAVFWFSAGAALALQKGESQVLRHQWVAVLLIPCVVADFLLQTRGLAEEVLRPALLLCGAGIVAGVFALAALVQQRTHWCLPRDFTVATMFIYCWHNVYLFGPEYILFQLMRKTGAFAWCDIGSPAALVYMLVPPVLEALAGVCVYKLLRRFLPRPSALLSGGK